MEKAKLDPWLERMNKSEKKDHKAIVEEMAKENAIKTGDAWKLLKLAGFNPKDKPETDQQTNQQNDPQTDPQNDQQVDQQVDQQNKTDEKKQPVILRHKTEYPRYRRAGLVLTQKAETYEVTEAQLAVLEKDPWVVIGDGKKDGAEK